MWEDAAGRETTPRTVPSTPLRRPVTCCPASTGLRVIAYADHCYGFLRLTVTAAELLGEFSPPWTLPTLHLLDSFRLDLDLHHLK